jgi:hypothetical protein
VVPPDLRNFAALSPGRLKALGHRLGPLATLERVLDWAAAQRPPRRVAQIVTQDEFTHDALIPLEPPLWLAFDVT